MGQFLIDSGAFLAMLDARDKFHAKAAEFISANPQATFYLPHLIFAETMTLVKARLGARAAILLGRQIHESPQFHVLDLSVSELETLWNIFSRYDDKEWSYADCALLVLARRLQVRDVFSFDHHIMQMAELTRVP